MLIVSFATDDKFYRGYYDRFRANLDEHGFEHDVRLIPPITDDKVAACCYRPEFLIDLLEEHKRPLFWMDADSVIHRPFDVTGDFDFAYCLNSQRTKRKSAPVITAGIFGFGYTPAAFAFLEEWRERCAGYDENQISSHRHLEAMHLETDVRQLDFTPSVTDKITFYGTKIKYAFRA